MFNEIKSITVTCKNCNTSVSFDVPDYDGDRSRAGVIANGIKSVVCPICRQPFESNLEDTVSDVLKFNSVSGRLEGIVSRRGVSFSLEPAKPEADTVIF